MILDSRRAFLRLLLNLPLFSFLPAFAQELSTTKNAKFKLAFGSCADQDYLQPIWDTIAGDEPDVFAFIGDNIYGDTEDMSVMASRYAQLGNISEFKEFRRKVPIIFTWDDHDFGVNDGGREYPRKAESKSLMFRFFNESPISARARRDGVYTSYMYGEPGQRTQVILLDLRWFRSELVPDIKGYMPNPDPNAVLLGEAQWKFLEAELRKPADFRILASSSQLVSSEHHWEKWANFPHEKARLMEMLDRLEIRNLAVISGDMHFGELSMEQTPGGFDLYDLTSSGLNYSEEAKGIPNSRRLALFDTGVNYGHVTVDYSHNSEVHVSLEVRDLKGEARIRRKLRYLRPILQS